MAIVVDRHRRVGAPVQGIRELNHRPEGDRHVIQGRGTQELLLRLFVVDPEHRHRPPSESLTGLAFEGEGRVSSKRGPRPEPAPVPLGYWYVAVVVIMVSDTIDFDRLPPNDHMSGRCRTGEGVKPALERVRAAQKDVAVARAQRRGGLPEDDVDLIVLHLASDLQLREVAPHGEPAGPHIAGVRRGGKLINWERFDRGALHVVSVDIEPGQCARCAETRHAPYRGLW